MHAFHRNFIKAQTYDLNLSTVSSFPPCPLTMATLVLLLGATLVAAAPRPRQAPSIENVLLFDSPATSSLVISQDVYAYTTTLDLTPISDFIQDTADTLGIDIGQDELSRAVDRFTLFGTDGSAGVELTVGCGEGGLALTPTSEKPDWGLARSVGSLEGSCQSSEETFEVKVVGTEFSATVYPFTDDGFGVISGMLSACLILDRTDLSRLQILTIPLKSLGQSYLM